MLKAPARTAVWLEGDLRKRQALKGVNTASLIYVLRNVLSAPSGAGRTYRRA